MRQKPYIFAAILLASSFSLRAVTEVDHQNDTAANTFDGDISSIDLINGLIPTAIFTTTGGDHHTAGDSFTVTDNSFPLSGVNDGRQGNVNDVVGTGSGSSLFANGQLGTELPANPQLTYSLDTTTSPLGYTLTGITSIFGFNPGYSAELADQYYTIAYSTVAAPTVFLPLTTVNFTPYGNVNGDGKDAAGSTSAGTEVLLSNLGATGVAAVQFTFMLPANEFGIQSGEYIREIDVNGVPTTAGVPEPATWAMIGIGAATLAFALRRRISA